MIINETIRIPKHVDHKIKGHLYSVYLKQRAYKWSFYLPKYNAPIAPENAPFST